MATSKLGSRLEVGGPRYVLLDPQHSASFQRRVRLRTALLALGVCLLLLGTLAVFAAQRGAFLPTGSPGSEEEGAGEGSEARGGQPEVKPQEGQAASQGEEKQQQQQEQQPQPEPQPEQQQEAQPAQQQEAQPAQEQDAQPAKQQDAQPVQQQDALPAQQQDAQPTQQQDVQPQEQQQQQQQGSEATEAAPAEPRKLFQDLLLIVSYEDSKDARATIRLFRAVYGRIFGNVTFISSYAMDDLGVEQAAPRPVIPPEDPAGLHVLKFNYGFLRRLVQRQYKSFKGVVWISSITVLNYWNLKGASLMRPWIPGPGTKDSTGKPLWYALGEGGEGDWSVDPEWKNRLQKVISRLPKLYTETLSRSLQAVTGSTESVAVRGPANVFFLPRHKFPQAFVLARMFHSAKVPDEIAVPTMMLALASPDEFDPVLSNFVYVGGGERGNIRYSKMLFKLDSTGLNPWPFYARDSQRQLLNLLAKGDPDLATTATTWAR